MPGEVTTPYAATTGSDAAPVTYASASGPTFASSFPSPIKLPLKQSVIAVNSGGWSPDTSIQSGGASITFGSTPGTVLLDIPALGVTRQPVAVNSTSQLSADLNTGSAVLNGGASAIANFAAGAATAIKAGATGTVRGDFYGPAANNMGAVWTLSDGTSAAIGTVGGRKP